MKSRFFVIPYQLYLRWIAALNKVKRISSFYTVLREQEKSAQYRRGVMAWVQIPAIKSNRITQYHS